VGETNLEIKKGLKTAAATITKGNRILNKELTKFQVVSKATLLNSFYRKLDE